MPSYLDRILLSGSKSNQNTAREYAKLFRGPDAVATPSPDSQGGDASSAPAPIDRWMNQIERFMTSDNPAVRDMGESMLQAYHQRASQEPKSKGAAIEGYEYAKDQGYPGSFMDFKNASKTKMYESEGDKSLSVSDIAKLVQPNGDDLPIGTTTNQANRLGATLRNQRGAEDAGKLAMLKSTMESFAITDAMVLPDNGDVNERALDAAFYLDLDPTPGHMGGEMILKSQGYGPGEIEGAKQYLRTMTTGIQAITRTETGAAMQDSEIKATKERFMPKPNDSPSVKKLRYLSFKYFIENAANMMDKKVQKNGTAEQLSAEVDKAAKAALDKFNISDNGEEIGVYEGDSNDIDFGDD